MNRRRLAVSLALIALGAPMTLGWRLAPAGDEAACPKDAPPRCEPARSRLAQAQSAVQEAAERRALWTTASDALHQAQGAFVRGDYDSAQRSADFAIEQARLGIAQRAYPMFPFPSH